MHPTLWIVLLCTLYAQIEASKLTPFFLSEYYVNNYEKGISDLKKLYHETVHHKPHLYHTKINATEPIEDPVHYDFIIVGAGNAGSALANRLSEVPEWKILLLEAGEAETSYTKIPVMKPYLTGTHYNWGYSTIPQKTWCKGGIDHKCYVPKGKALGGSSVINSMTYTRGNKRDYDIWSDQGNYGWCFEHVLPYFKKLENAHLHEFDHKYHKQGGPVQVEDPQHVTHYLESFLEAGKELGEKIVDYNGHDQLGFSQSQVNTKYGKRQSAAEAYLTSCKDRPNLIIRPLSQVTEVVMNPHIKEAKGVKYVHDDKLFIAKANKEVILSAGAINSAQLLMLSGIGPKDELDKHHIPVVCDLPVGQHLKDHIRFLGLNFIVNTTKHHLKCGEHDEHDDLVKWLKSGKGPLSSVDIEGVGFVKTKHSKDKGHYPDVELMFSPRLDFSGKLDYKNLHLTKEVYDSTYAPLEGHDIISIGVSVTHPRSVGSVCLNSKDPFDWPLIDLNLLSDSEDYDIHTMIAGIHKAIELLETKAFKKLDGHLHKHPVAGCEEHEYGTDEYWSCAVRHFSKSLGHQTGTCRMGPETDKLAVVDNKLNVLGTEKLRVVDASVIPVSITGHLRGPVTMLAEKAADIIKEFWLS